MTSRPASVTRQATSGRSGDGEPFLTDGAEVEDRALKAAGETLAMVYDALGRHDWAQLVGYADLALATGPTIEPSWYRAHADNIAANKRLLAATADYLARLRSITDTP